MLPIATSPSDARAEAQLSEERWTPVNSRPTGTFAIDGPMKWRS
jgi:hypothetical protein